MITFFHCAWAWSWHNNIFLFKVAYLLCTLYTNQLSQSSQESHPSYETLVFSVDELVFNRCRWSSAQENIFLHKKSFCVIHKKTFYFFTPLFFLSQNRVLGRTNYVESLFECKIPFLIDPLSLRTFCVECEILL